MPVQGVFIAGEDVLIVTREFAGSSREIIGATCDYHLIHDIIGHDIGRWTLPITYTIERHTLAEKK